VIDFGNEIIPLFLFDRHRVESIDILGYDLAGCTGSTDADVEHRVHGVFTYLRQSRLV
jgi:hypothetical protein